MFVNCCITARIRSIVVGNDEREFAMLIIPTTWVPFRHVGPDILHSAALKPPSPSSRVAFSSAAPGGRARLVCEVQTVHHYWTQIHGRSLADDGNLVERDAKRKGIFIVTPRDSSPEHRSSFEPSRVTLFFLRARSRFVLSWCPLLLKI